MFCTFFLIIVLSGGQSGEYMARRTTYIIIFVFMFFSVAFYAVHTELLSTTEALYDYNDSWLCDNDGKQRNLNHLLPYAPGTPGQVTLRFTRTLPPSFSGSMSFGFISHDVSFTLLIGGEKRYEYLAVPNLTGIGYGRLIHNVSLESSDAGKAVTFEIRPVYEDCRGGIEDAFLCAPHVYGSLLLRKNIIGFILSLATMIIGLIMLLIRYAAVRRVDTPDGLMLGVAVVLIGAWSVNETLLPLMILRDPVFVSMMDYILLLLSPYPLSVYFQKATGTGSRWYKQISFFAMTGAVFATLFLRFVLGKDITAANPVIVGQILLSLLLVLMTLLKSARTHRKEQTPDENTLLYIGGAVMVCGALLDSFFFLTGSSPFTDDGICTKFGLVIMVTLLLLQLVRQADRQTQAFLTDMLEQRNMQVYLERCSYRDELTDVMNRRALEEYGSRVLGGEGVLPSAVVICDLNGLKKMNDEEGHASGDVAIRAVANALGGVFGSENVFRMGGDEFLAIAPFCNKDMFYLQIADARRRITQSGYSASIGWKYRTGEEKSLTDMIRAADEKMYLEKQAYYKDSNNRRRSAAE